MSGKKKQTHLFHKNSVKIPSLAVGDDIIKLLECGHKTNAMIAYIEQKQCKQNKKVKNPKK